MAVKENIKHIIRDRGLRQGYVAQKAGLPEKQFSALLTGRKVFRIEHLVPICNALDMNPNQVIFYSEEPTSSGEADSPVKTFPKQDAEEQT
jgi:DNA-binding Xre family transcriptional regulator